MKNKNYHLVLFLFLSLFLIQSCENKDDDATNTILKEITFGDETFSLENANLYILRDSNSGIWKYRDYIISDGAYKDNGSIGWNIEDYENATYALVIELAVRSEETSETIITGEYPQWSSWNTAASSDENMISYVYMVTSEGSYETLSESDGGDHPTIVVSGGVENGEKMIFNSEGIMAYDNGTDNIPVNFTLSFEGTVMDKVN